MSYKRLIPCIFIKDGKAVRWIDDPTVVSKDVIELAKYYSDHGSCWISQIRMKNMMKRSH